MYVCAAVESFTRCMLQINSYDRIPRYKHAHASV